MSSHVDVHRHELSCQESSCTCIPPPEKVEPSANCEYRCEPIPARHIPPIGENYLMHCYSSPSCVNPSQKWVYNQIPKKLGAQLQSREDGPALGWGVHFEEGWNWDKIVALELIIVVLGGALFAVLWSVWKHDIQGAFAISAYWLVACHALLGLVARQTWVPVQLIVRLSLPSSRALPQREVEGWVEYHFPSHTHLRHRPQE